MTWKRFKIGGKLVLTTNRKSHMGFRLVQKSVTLNDLERVMVLILCYFADFDIAFWAHYVKVVISHQQILSREMP